MATAASKNKRINHPAAQIFKPMDPCSAVFSPLGKSSNPAANRTYQTRRRLPPSHSLVVEVHRLIRLHRHLDLLPALGELHADLVHLPVVAQPPAASAAERPRLYLAPAKNRTVAIGESKIGDETGGGVENAGWRTIGGGMAIGVGAF